MLAGKRRSLNVSIFAHSLRGHVDLCLLFRYCHHGVKGIERDDCCLLEKTELINH